MRSIKQKGIDTNRKTYNLELSIVSLLKEKNDLQLQVQAVSGGIILCTAANQDASIQL